jgi:AraC family transcriptional regulator
VAWLCPAGVLEEEVIIHAPIELLHVYLPASRFEQLAEVCGGALVSATAVGYIDGIQDPLIHQIGVQILSELKCQTASGHVLVDALSLALTARLVQAYAATEGRSLNPRATHHGLGKARLGRVLEFIRTHIEENIGIDDLASVACLSPFHFARMFRTSMGVPPHRYLSSLRLERSKEALARSDKPLAEIALAACFSTQANFTRAFRMATGMTPGDFRRQAL